MQTCVDTAAMNSLQNDQQHQPENSGEKDQDDSTQIAGGQSSFRPIVPGPSFPDQGRTPAELRRTLGPGWKKRVSTACLACKKSKRKVYSRLRSGFGVYAYDCTCLVLWDASMR